MQEITKLFKILSDSNRLEIFKIILQKKKSCVCDIARITKLKRNLISHHLKTLEKANLIKHSKVGRNVYYCINEDYITYIKNLICNFFDNEKNF